MKSRNRNLAAIMFVIVLVTPSALVFRNVVREQRRQNLNRALFVAIKSNDSGRVSAYITSGADPNARDWKPDARSFTRRIWDLLRGAKPNRGYADTALLVAEAVNGRSQERGMDNDVIKALLDAGANPNTRNQYGNTPLMITAETSRPRVVGLLLDYGAHVNDKVPGKWTALYEALYESDQSSVDQLLSHGAIVNDRDKFGVTPLMMAAAGANWTNDSSSKLRLMLLRTKDVNARDVTGKTAHFYATGWPDRMRRLLDAGANVNVRDNNGMTPLMTVKFNPFMTRMLKQAGEKK